MIRLIVTNQVVESIFHHADAERPNECCGFLAGHIRDNVGYVVESIPLVNEYQSPIAYRTEAKSLLAAHHRLLDRKYDLIAVYHSHPNLSAIPSRRDRDDWTYGNTGCAIIGMKDGTPELRVWQLDGDCATELQLEITGHQTAAPSVS